MNKFLCGWCRTQHPVSTFEAHAESLAAKAISQWVYSSTISAYDIASLRFQNLELD